MYGQPLDPKKTTFAIESFEGDDISIFLSDDEDDDNDNVRDVNHPDFDFLWENTMENCFEASTQEGIDFTMRLRGLKKEDLKHIKPITSIEEGRKWLLSIGMTEEKLS